MILNQDDIKKYLPHREPFLFIDEVISLEEGDNIEAGAGAASDATITINYEELS